MASATETDPVTTRRVVEDITSALKLEATNSADVHLRDLMSDEARCKKMVVEHDGILLDYSRQRLTESSTPLLFKLAEATQLTAKISDMFSGKKINTTEDRAVLHVALRAAASDSITLDGVDVVPEVLAVQQKIAAFSDKVRSGQWLGATGRPLTDIVAVGIGGSYLGPEFVYEALRTDGAGKAASDGRKLRFLANVDPVDVARATEGLDPQTTMVVVVSKTFTTAETMLNARTMRRWLSDALGAEAVAKHMVAVSTNLKLVTEFGIDPENVFGFWDWVGGRYSVCSAVGLVPLSLHFGFPIMEKFLAGAHDMDVHFKTAPAEKNIPIVMGLIGVWNSTFLGHATRALLPYSQALLKLAPHIQQVDMESNGKRVLLSGAELSFQVGPINFGEPGTNGQHSFYQLMHQGRVVPADFIGLITSQQPLQLDGEPVSNHEELMSNFFAQPDALAYGKTAEEVRAEGVAEELVPHKVFSGNRPSSSMLLPNLDARRLGQLLSIFEHRTAVEGFIWDINSFDQWGVELGKVLAKQVRTQISASKKENKPVTGFNPSTTALLNRFLQRRETLPIPSPTPTSGSRSSSMEFFAARGVGDALETLAESTLVAPTVSIGNVPQLTLDLLVHSLKVRLIGRLASASVLPFAGPAEPPQGAPDDYPKVATALELFHCPEAKLVFLQQRAPPARGRAFEYGTQLGQWASKHVCGMLLLSSVSKAGGKDAQLSAGSAPYRWMATSKAVEDGTWTRRVTYPKVEGSSSSLGWDPVLPELGGASWEDSQKPSFMPSSRRQSFVRGLLESSEQSGFALFVAVMFVHEGANTAEAVDMAGQAAALLAISPDPEAEASEKSRSWRAPGSWAALTGGLPSRSMY